MALNAETVFETLKSVLPPEKEFIALHEPSFQGNEWNYVKECLDSGWVSSVGKFVDRFEADLAAYTGVKRAIAVVNGTAALHISLLLAGVQPGDEVLLPALTFVATANAVAYCHAIPHFIDSEEDTLGVDVSKLEAYLTDIAKIEAGQAINRHTGRCIRALVVMHTFGHPVDLDAAKRVCDHFGITLIEDAAESLGSFYKGRHTGSHGRLSAISFNGNKIITTGGGGAILTNDDDLANQAKHLTTTAKTPHKWLFVHDHVGYNYRLPNLNAALGCAQLEQLPSYLEQKRLLAARYATAFSTIEGLRFVQEPSECQSNYWLNVLLLDADYAHLRDSILALCNANNLMVRPAWTLMHRLPMYQHCPAMALDTAESLEARLINIPSSPFL